MRTNRIMPFRLLILFLLVLACPGGALLGDTQPTEGLVNYETPHVHPIDLTPDARTLLAVNTAGHALEVFDVQEGSPVPVASIPVGIDPVSVRARSNTEAWVVNHLSDSVSIVDLTQRVVVATLQTRNEPADVVFAGSPIRAFVSCSEANLIQVFDPTHLDQLPHHIAIGGEDPRALAVSPDGRTVYVAIFESGNSTTAVSGDGSVNAEDVISRPEGPYAGQIPPPNDGADLRPPLNPALPEPPNTSLIVRKDASGRWMDDNDGDWSLFVSGGLASLTNRVPGWDLPDRDVAVIDTQTLAVSYQTRLMNIVMAMDVHPVSGKVTIVGTEAMNEVRFEPNLNGVFLRVQCASFTPGDQAKIDDLNPHLDYTTSTVAEDLRTQSIGDPRGIAWRKDGQRAFVTGMGSNNVIVIDSDGVRQGHFDVGEGPTGIVLDDANDRGFVLNKFAGSISMISLSGLETTLAIPFDDPTPQVIKDGRPFLYNTHRTSGLGHVSCASCHVDARTDRLSWDLGNPAGVMETVLNANNTTGNTSGTTTVHPMKGPMLTQTLQDIMDYSTLHWRGDRADLNEFNGAFVSLMGAPSQIPEEDMETFGAFLDTIHLPPNPYREIDNSRPSTITLPSGFEAHTTTFTSLRGQNSRSNNCLRCHLNGEKRNDASNKELGQAFAAPAIAPLYDRLGFWPSLARGSTTGFGFFHDGADDLHGAARTNTAESQTDMLAELLTLEGPDGLLTGAERRQDSHAGVGQQVTLNGLLTSAQSSRVHTLVSIADGSRHAELIVRGRIHGSTRGYLLTSSDTFQSDRQGETETLANLLTLASTGNPLTFTIVANGMGSRLSIDDDLDGILNQDENARPVITDPGHQRDTVTATVSLAIVASDADGDPLTYSATGLPPGLSVDATTGIISGTLLESAMGVHTVTLAVTDDIASVLVSFEWQVVDASGNVPVAISALSDHAHRTGEAVSIIPQITNPDNDLITFTSTPLPDGLALNAETGEISGTLTEASAGRYQITLTVSDSTSSDRSTFHWRVQGVLLTEDFSPGHGWVADPNGTDTAETGTWAVGSPQGTSSGGVVQQLGSAVIGSQALFTGPLAGSGVGSHDVDGGITTMRSPEVLVPLEGMTTLSLSYSFAHLSNATDADFFRILVEGEELTPLLEERGTASARAGSWTGWTADLTPFAGQTITLRIEAADVATASLIEASVDAVEILTMPPNGAPSIATVENQTTLLGSRASLQIQATDPNGDPITFDAEGLPEGLRMDASGLITGTPTALGSRSVTIGASDGIHRTTTQFVWTIDEGNVAEANRLSRFHAPARVTQGDTLTVTVDYESTDAHELWIWLQDSNDQWRTAGVHALTLSPGLGTGTFEILIENHARVGDGYVWIARLLPQGWESADDALDALYLEGQVDAHDTGGGDEPTTDSLGDVALPSEVFSPDTMALEIPYEATESREIHVWLHDSTDGWSTLGEAQTVVPPGVGIATLDVSLLPNGREGAGYLWALRMLPLDWSTADDALDAVYEEVHVSRNDGGGASENRIHAVALPTIIEAAQTINVEVDYETTDRRDLGIWIHDSTDDWRVVAHGLRKVDPGRAGTSFTLGIAADARIGEDYVVAIRLLPEGWVTADDALDAFYADAEVIASHNHLVNYAVLPQASATQSSTYGSAFVSDLVRDGNADGDWRHGSVSHTELDPNAWWEVDLGSIKAIDHILIWNRSDCCGERLAPYYVFTSDAPFTSTDLETTRAQAGVGESYFANVPSPTQRVEVGRTGRYVRIQLAGSNYLSLAEVEVFGENEGPVNGLSYHYYEGNWDALPDFESLTAFTTGTTLAPDLSEARRGDFFAIRYQACLNVVDGGEFTFYLTSDEGGRLVIRDDVVVSQDGLHGMQETSGTITLSAGMHPIEIHYFEREGGEALTFHWEGPGIAKEPIPANRFFLNETGDTVAMRVSRQIRPDANHDGDLLDLTAEHALGMNPYDGHLPTLGLQSLARPDGTGVDLWYERPARLTEYHYSLEVSADATHWERIDPPEIIHDFYGWERLHHEHIDRRIPDSDAGFARLRIRHHAWNYETTTPIIGWQRTRFHPGYQSHGVSLPHAPVFASVLTNISTTTVSVATTGIDAALGNGTAGSGNRLPCYLEFITGPFAGHRLELDSSETSEHTLGIAWASPDNTLNALSDAMIGSQILVRPFRTLSDVYAEDHFQAGRDPDGADQLQFYRQGRYDGFLLLHAGFHRYWTALGDAALPDRSHARIRPGEGLFVLRTAESPALTHFATGHVRLTPFAQPLLHGHHLLASPHPFAHSPDSRGFVSQTPTFTGNVDPSEADQFLLWMGDGQEPSPAYASYFLLDGGPSWRHWTGIDDPHLESVNALPLFPGNRAFFFWASHDHPHHMIPAWDSL